MAATPSVPTCSPRSRQGYSAQAIEEKFGLTQVERREAYKIINEWTSMKSNPSSEEMIVMDFRIKANRKRLQSLHKKLRAAHKDLYKNHDNKYVDAAIRHMVSAWVQNRRARYQKHFSKQDAMKELKSIINSSSGLTTLPPFASIDSSTPNEFWIYVWDADSTYTCEISLDTLVDCRCSHQICRPRGVCQLEHLSFSKLEQYLLEHKIVVGERCLAYYGPVKGFSDNPCPYPVCKAGDLKRGIEKELANSKYELWLRLG